MTTDIAQTIIQQYFPGMDLPAITAECLRIAYERNTSAAIRHLRNSL